MSENNGEMPGEPVFVDKDSIYAPPDEPPIPAVEASPSEIKEALGGRIGLSDVVDSTLPGLSARVGRTGTVADEFGGEEPLPVPELVVDDED